MSMHWYWKIKTKGRDDHMAGIEDAREKIAAEFKEVEEAIAEDRINHPGHYTSGGIETIDYIKSKLSPEGFEGFCIGNVIKYLSRYREKNGMEDLKKARWYLDRIIEHVGAESKHPGRSMPPKGGAMIYGPTAQAKDNLVVWPRRDAIVSKEMALKLAAIKDIDGIYIFPELLRIQP
jgi:hypothetical protein